MSDWDFLYELKGQELKDALGSGASYSDWDYIERQQKERNRKKQSTKKKILIQMITQLFAKKF